MPLSLIACVSDDAILKANLLASPDLASAGSPHEVILIHEAPSAAAGYVMGRQKARHEWNVFVHQDVGLPAGWDKCLARQLREAERQFGPIGVAGVYGVGEVIQPSDPTLPLGARRIGWVVDRGRELRDGRGSSWRWLMTCSSITLAAGHSPGRESMPRSCWTKTPAASRPSGD
jgi:hypothetical protein